jgi:hypothetical protein
MEGVVGLTRLSRLSLRLAPRRTSIDTKCGFPRSRERQFLFAVRRCSCERGALHCVFAFRQNRSQIQRDRYFKALYGSEEATAATAKDWKIIFQKAQVKDEFTYLVDHSTQMYVFDKAARIRLMIRHEAGVDAIAQDLTTLVRA